VLVSFACGLLHAASPHPALALIEKATAAVRIDPEASRQQAEQALQLLKRSPDADLEVRARLLLCGHLSERDAQAAAEQATLAEALLAKTTRRGLSAGVLECRGTIAETAGNNTRARDLYEKAVSVASAAGDDEMLAAALFSRGYLLGLQGEYAAGLTDLRRAQTLYNQVGLPTHALTALNSIAILYNRMGDFAEARHMYSRALKAQRDSGLRREQGVTLHNLGRAHENLREWEAARAAFQESLDISRELHYQRGEAYALRGLAAVANAQNDPQRAIETLDVAALLQQQTPDARLQAQIQLARGVALYQLKDYMASATALEEALKVFEQADSLNELRATYAALAETHSAMNDWRVAYGYQGRAQETADRLFRNQIDQRFTTLKVEFDTAAKEKENELLLRENDANSKALQQERKARNLQAVVIGLTIVLALVLATLAAHQWRSTRRMRSLAMTDELTGVPNRRAVLRRLAALLESDTPHPSALLIVDIDHFKSINDQFGHSEGDEALKLVASKLRDEVKEPVFIGRLGGEEFVIVAPGVDVDVASQLAERCREQVTTIDMRRWLNDYRITVSVGVSVTRIEGDTAGSILERADAALYDAKRSGRNCVKIQLATPFSGMPAESGTSTIGIEYA
jgi:diguanylate cyclase (GGDEF)-like protein